MSLGPLYVLLGEVSVQVFCPFFNWIVCLPGVESCEFLICFGDQTLVQGVIGNIFSHMVGSLFILPMFYLFYGISFLLPLFSFFPTFVIVAQVQLSPFSPC